jgi:hypothetical protein
MIRVAKNGSVVEPIILAFTPSVSIRETRGM